MALWQDVSESLRRKIADGDYPPGTIIPHETDLIGYSYDQAAHGWRLVRPPGSRAAPPRLT